MAKRRKLSQDASNGLIQAGYTPLAEDLDAAVLDSAWTEFTTHDLAIQTVYKGTGEFYFSHTDSDANKIFPLTQITVDGAGQTVYIKSVSGTITVYRLANLAIDGGTI